MFKLQSNKVSCPAKPMPNACQAASQATLMLEADKTASKVNLKPMANEAASQSKPILHFCGFHAMVSKLLHMILVLIYSSLFRLCMLLKNCLFQHLPPNSLIKLLIKFNNIQNSGHYSLMITLYQKSFNGVLSKVQILYNKVKSIFTFLKDLWFAIFDDSTVSAMTQSYFNS